MIDAHVARMTSAVSNSAVGETENRDVLIELVFSSDEGSKPYTASRAHSASGSYRLNYDHLRQVREQKAVQTCSGQYVSSVQRLVATTSKHSYDGAAALSTPLTLAFSPAEIRHHEADVPRRLKAVINGGSIEAVDKAVPIHTKTEGGDSDCPGFPNPKPSSYPATISVVIGSLTHPKIIDPPLEPTLHLTGSYPLSEAAPLMAEHGYTGKVTFDITITKLPVAKADLPAQVKRGEPIAFDAGLSMGDYLEGHWRFKVDRDRCIFPGDRKFDAIRDGISPYLDVMNDQTVLDIIDSRIITVRSADQADKLRFEAPLLCPVTAILTISDINIISQYKKDIAVESRVWTSVHEHQPSTKTLLRPRKVNPPDVFDLKHVKHGDGTETTSTIQAVNVPSFCADVDEFMRWVECRDVILNPDTPFLLANLFKFAFIPSDMPEMDGLLVANARELSAHELAIKPGVGPFGGLFYVDVEPLKLLWRTGVIDPYLVEENPNDENPRELSQEFKQENQPETQTGNISNFYDCIAYHEFMHTVWFNRNLQSARQNKFEFNTRHGGDLSPQISAFDPLKVIERMFDISANNLIRRIAVVMAEYENSVPNNLQDINMNSGNISLIRNFLDPVVMGRCARSTSYIKRGVRLPDTGVIFR